MNPVRCVVLILALAVGACGGRMPEQDALARGPLEAALLALDRTPESQQGELVRGVASSRIADRAREPDAAVRDATFARLRAGGNGTRLVLEDLARDDDEDVATRALFALVLRGDARATRRLARYTDHEDEGLRNRALAAEARGLSRVDAIARLSASSAAERLEALLALRGKDDPDTVLAVLAVARRDPEDSVRAAACGALPRLGEVDRATLRAIVDEATASTVVTACARRAIEGLDEDAALAFVLGLADPADDLAIARAHAALTSSLPARAEQALDAFLGRALAAPRPSIRAAAASLVGMRRDTPALRDALVAALDSEGDDVAKLALCAALRREASVRARVLVVLHELIAREDAIGLEAASLAHPIEGFTPESQARVERALGSSEPHIRALAFGVFVRANDHRRALEGLFDADASVRITTAIAIFDR